MNLRKCILTKSDCYKKGTKITPVGIIVHSTGANNPYLKRYVQPDDGLLGINKNNNSWNRPGLNVGVHAFIGKDKDGNVQVYQTLPFDIASWGIGRGKKGSYNYNPTAHIQFEICEDNLSDEKYFNEVFNLAAEFCAYLCERYNLKVQNVISHHEGYLKGYGSNHADCDHWLKKFKKDMNWFRELVDSKMNNQKEDNTNDLAEKNSVNYTVKINTKELNVRAEPNAASKINTTVKQNEVYTIIEESNGWGKLKSGSGWISLNYTQKYNKETKVESNKSYTHKVIKGDTLEKICIKYYGKSNQTLINNIVTSNKLKYPKITKNFIIVGWILTIPNK